ncbi:MAG: hypothetical protein EOO70_03670 [Myxococcaceae bacterium]|nr:MAG: hypothetical protein EOO70_03670 [Myxococcaceae bacterium]
MTTTDPNQSATILIPYDEVHHEGEALVFYHRTSPESATSIAANGFIDATRDIGEVEVVGVWVSNYPLDANTGAKGRVLLRLVVAATLDELDDYEVVNEECTYREWCIPADLLKKRARVECCSEEEEENITVVFPETWPDEAVLGTRREPGISLVVSDRSLPMRTRGAGGLGADKPWLT